MTERDKEHDAKRGKKNRLFDLNAKYADVLKLSAAIKYFEEIA